MQDDVAVLERHRRDYRPRLPERLARGISGLSIVAGEPSEAVRDAEAVRGHFPRSFGRPLLRCESGDGPGPARALTVGVVLSGGQAPGGHNVIVGIHDAIAAFHPQSRLHGFLGGPKGIFTERHRELTADELARYRNSGGFDLIGSGRDKIESAEQLTACREVCERMALDGLVVIGGDDSNTNAAVLAEAFAEAGSRTTVVGVPKTIDGDLKGGSVECSFGFDTATRVYSELIGNICRDALSAGKYWHFVKLMGRSASHVTLECALQTHPNVALIGEEVHRDGRTLRSIVEGIADTIVARAEAGLHHGVCLIPEGLIEFVPEMRALIDELNRLLSEKSANIETIASMDERRAFVAGRLGGDASALFGFLPQRIQEQLLLDRDSHGNVQVSKIDTEQMLSEQVKQVLAERDFGGKWQVQHHFFGYEGRCAAPTNFDADYTYALGTVAAALVAFGHSGYLAAVGGLAARPGSRQALGVPLTSLMQIEERKGRPTPVIGKALVDLEGRPFRQFAASREAWARADAYRYPGPIQYFGPDEVSGGVSLTLELES